MSTRDRFLRNSVLRLVTARVPPRVASLFRKVLHRPLSRAELHAYWRNPWDGENLPVDYLRPEARSSFFVSLVRKYAVPGAKVLELGCNVGKNLHFLFQAGFTRLTGVEISEAPLRLFRTSYPETAHHTTIHHVPIESVIQQFSDREFDVVFTMAVLEHIHTESEWIFPEIARITGDLLITIEDEGEVSQRIFPRNYRQVFEPAGLRHSEVIQCGEPEGFKPGIMARVYRKETTPVTEGQVIRPPL